MTLEFILRLAIAAVLGGVIGLEREYRAKEAGFRTHFLVALGSALFMILSMYGFDSMINDTAQKLSPITNCFTSSARHRFYRCRHHHLPKTCRQRTHNSCRTMGHISHRTNVRCRHVCPCRSHHDHGTHVPGSTPLCLQPLCHSQHSVDIQLRQAREHSACIA